MTKTDRELRRGPQAAQAERLSLTEELTTVVGDDYTTVQRRLTEVDRWIASWPEVMLEERECIG